MKLSRLFGAIGAVLVAALVAQAQVPGVNSTLNTVFNLVYEASTSKPTYVSGRYGITVAAAATDVCVLQGNSAKTVRVRRVMLSGQTSVATADPIQVILRTAANSGGTSTLAPAMSYASANSASTSLVTIYTANPVLGTTVVAEVADPLVLWGNLGTTQSPQTNYHFGEFGSPVFLRGSSQYLAVNLNALTYVNGSFNCWFEWTEDSDS